MSVLEKKNGIPTSHCQFRGYKRLNTKTNKLGMVPHISKPRRLRQEDCGEFKASLDYIVPGHEHELRSEPLILKKQTNRLVRGHDFLKTHRTSRERWRHLIKM